MLDNPQTISSNGPSRICKNFPYCSYFIVVSTNDDEPGAADVQDSLVEDIGLCEKSQQQLVPVNYFMYNRADDSGNFQL